MFNLNSQCQKMQIKIEKEIMGKVIWVLQKIEKEAESPTAVRKK